MATHPDIKPITFLTVLLNALLPVFCSLFNGDCFLSPSVNEIDYYKAVVFEGSNITATCDLWQNGENNFTSSDISWYHDNNPVIPNDHYTIVNQTRNILSLYNVTLFSTGSYFCMANDYFITSCDLYVGRKPSILQNLTIISPNLDEIFITWTARNAYIFTNYTMAFRFSKKHGYLCDITECKNKNNEDVYNCTCHLANAQFLYLNDLQFVIRGSNELETIDLYHATILPEHYAKFEPPTDLQVISKNSSMLFITWKFEFRNIPLDPSPLFYEVFYKLIICKENEHNEGLIQQYKGINTSEPKITINNLKPYGNYSIKIHCKLNYTTSYYSDFAFLNTTTDGDVPQDTPVIMPGMFYVRQAESSRKVSIYWKDIDKTLYGSPNINYSINFENGNKYESFKLSTNQTSIENVKLHNDMYKLTIRAKNSYGLAKKKSTIIIPAHIQILDNLEVDFFLCLVYPDRLNLSWIPLPKDSSVTVITIYWCMGYRGSLNCLRTLSWIHLTKNCSSWEMPVNLNIRYQVATSVESTEMYSGMKWLSDCNFIKPDNFDELDFKFESSTDSITIVWQSLSKQLSVIKNYIIRFCPEHECKDAILEKVIPKNSIKFVLTGLRPCTKYNITILINLVTGMRMEHKNVVCSTKRN